MGKILVTGASGNLGSAVIKHLTKTYDVAASEIVAGSRNLEKLTALGDQGIELRGVDFDDAATLDAAFNGIETLFLISTDALAVPGQRLKQHRAAIEAAKRAGVKRLVYTSMPSPERSLISFAPDHAGTEQAVKASGIDYVILRNTWYLENYLESLPHDLQSGKWYTATNGGKVSNISRDDLAKAAAAVLAKGNVINETLTFSGTKSHTIAELAKIVSDVAGKPLEAVEASKDDLRGGMKGAGLPDFLIDMLISTEDEIAHGNFDVSTSDFERVTGETPQSAEDFFKANKAKLTA